MKAITHNPTYLETGTSFPNALMRDTDAPVQDLDVSAPTPTEVEPSREIQTTGLSYRCIEHSRVWTPARREAVESYVKYLQSALRL